MKKVEKAEIIINNALGVLSIALAVFMTVYEYHAIGRYAETLLGTERASYGVAMILVFIFVYLICGAGALFFGLLLFGLTRQLYRADRGKETLGYIKDKTNALKLKNRTLIALIVFKSIAAGIALFLTIAVFDMQHTTVLSKIVYIFATISFFSSLIVSIVVKKKITSDGRREIHTENNL